MIEALIAIFIGVLFLAWLLARGWGLECERQDRRWQKYYDARTCIGCNERAATQAHPDGGAGELCDECAKGEK